MAAIVALQVVGLGYHYREESVIVLQLFLQIQPELQHLSDY